MRRVASAFIMTIFVAILFIGGVSASWGYSAYIPDAISGNLTIALDDFMWTGVEELPEDEESGLDHVWLIQNLVDGSSSGDPSIGLNDPNSTINDYINDRLKGGWGWKRNYFGSMAVTGDEEMEAIFGAAAKGLSFIIEVDETNSNVYYIYTTDVVLGERGEPNWLGTSNKTPGKPTVPIGQYIEVIYRTKIVRENASAPFDIIETKKGKALSDWYDENRSNANVTQIPAFDVNTWVEIA